MSQKEIDIMYMRRCLQLAANGLGRVRPNPLVGCVVVQDGHIVSEGYHQEYGHNHAERNALLRIANGKWPIGNELETVNASAKPATGHRPLTTLYVNLEPCSHYGKTPPCADLIVEKGIRRVVCCNDDPNPLVAGRGFAKLEAAGIEVVRHVLEDEGRKLNRRFFTFMEKKRPYIILKWAESADGFMAPTGSKCCNTDTTHKYWLSSQPQNRLNHRWRTEEAAILVGSDTFLQDSPSLTPRHYLGPAPQPIVLDRRNRLANIPNHWLHLQTPTVEETVHALYERKLQSVIVEGGRKILDAFIAAGLYDEVRILRSPIHLGDGLPAPTVPPVAPDRLIIVDTDGQIL